MAMAYGLSCGFPVALIAAKNAIIRLHGTRMAESPLMKRQKKNYLNKLDKPYISGITFSGGDPLHAANRMEVRSLMAEIKEKYPNKTIWLYTGDVWENIFRSSIMQYIDVVVDGEFQADLKDPKLLWKGSKNQRVIDVQRSLQSENPGIPILHCNDYSSIS